jgi:hypothetical protein
MADTIAFRNLLTVVNQGAGSVASAPIQLDASNTAGLNLFLTSDNTQYIKLPTNRTGLDLESLTATFYCQGTTGTTVTGKLECQGAASLTDVKTVATAIPNAAATSVAVAARDGFTQNNYVLMVEPDGSAYEWVQTTSANATGAGSLTLVRGQLGTTARSFVGLPLLFTTNGWVDVPTGLTSGTTTMNVTNSSLHSPAASINAPNIVQLDMQNEAMNRIAFPFIRFLFTVGGTGTPVVTAGYLDVVTQKRLHNFTTRAR